MKAFES